MIRPASFFIMEGKVRPENHPEEPPNTYDIRIGTEVQASSSWVSPRGTLGTLVSEAAERVQVLRSRARDLEAAAAAARQPPSLARALRRSDIAIIAEIKRRSP